MKIATWNVNSIRSRLDRLLSWLEKAEPDVLCLQELKVANDAFPYDAIRNAGYHAAVHGQKTYNGVAVLSRQEATDVRVGLDDEDEQARLITVDLAGIHVASVYVPNGQSVGSEKWAYKLQWLGKLRKYLDERFDASTPLVLGGDFNVAIDDLDVANPQSWAGSVLCHQDAREALENVKRWGLTDVFREHHPQGGVYSWWDYRMLSFPKNDGVRIDHLLASAPMAQQCTAAEIDREERKGTKPSDHAPVVGIFAE